LGDEASPADAAVTRPTAADAGEGRSVVPFSGPGRPRRASDAAWRTALVAALGLLVAVTSFAAGMLAERDLLRGDAVAEVPDDFQRVAEVGALISDEYYYQPDDPEGRARFRQELEDAALEAMTATLEDPYTDYLPPAEAAPVNAQLAGEYEGIGVTIQPIDGDLTVIAPVPGGPADRAGIRAGDVLRAADGHPLANLGDGEAAKLVSGPAGTTVVLTVARPGVPEPFEVEVTREKIVQQVVRYELLESSRVAHIRVIVFGDTTIAQLDEALGRAQVDGAVGIVLDLRDNGGGWVTAAQEMIGRFVPADRGPALYEDLGTGPADAQPEPILGGEIEAFETPLVVLVNGGTASAAEIVAGALDDYDRAPLVGAPTFGKGSVQRVHDFPDGASARITIAEWLTPNREQIPDTGLALDVPIPQVPEPEAGIDPQLAAAARVLTTGAWSEVSPAW
jgi:carboxyl-terminal processing protease